MVILLFNPPLIQNSNKPPLFWLHILTYPLDQDDAEVNGLEVV